VTLKERIEKLELTEVLETSHDVHDIYSICKSFAYENSYELWHSWMTYGHLDQEIIEVFDSIDRLLWHLACKPDWMVELFMEADKPEKPVVTMQDRNRAYVLCLPEDDIAKMRSDAWHQYNNEGRGRCS
jgi:uncharacterized damage-inducible protein DinB